MLDMPIRSFTNKKIRELNDTHNRLIEEIRVLSSKNEKDLWLSDMDDLEKA